MTTLTTHIYPSIDADLGEISIDTAVVDQFGMHAQKLHREVIRTKDRIVYMGLTALGWSPPAGLHEVVFAETDDQAEQARAAMGTINLAAAIEQAGPEALHAALAELGWDHLGRGIWAEPE